MREIVAEPPSPSQDASHVHNVLPSPAYAVLQSPATLVKTPTHDTSTVLEIKETPPPPKSFCHKLLPALSSAFVTSIAYIDPGSMASNIEGGAEYGLTLLWVILCSSLIAMLFQILSAKLGLASGKSLAQVTRDAWPKWAVYVCWFVAEVSVVTCDVSEFIGAAVAYKLLFGIPLAWGGILTGFTTLALLVVHNSKAAYFEAAIFAFVSMIVVCYIVQTALSSVDWPQVAYHTFVPSFDGPGSVVNAVGIVGATVTPYAIFLHSELTKGRHERGLSGETILPPLEFEIAGIAIALGVAAIVNIAMLTMSASTFYVAGYADLDVMENAYKTLEPLLGKAASIIFGVGLLAAGISSSAVGTLAGQVIMGGFTSFHLSMWLRWAITVTPCLVILFCGFSPTSVLMVCNVVGSFCVPFCLVPVVVFTSQRSIMGEWTNSTFMVGITSFLTFFVIGLDVYLIATLF
ncbi:hypothetical protein SPRG_15540 [Saprolegnia parasitica CBS 223.65]|uniref:Uncharacterized protein n=1 Tax=Saprolegnia parasitica (strain CBS 223.65) TaxID=695850 RepID=A0A067BR54_SAPPC|nr:hypothetical protein SPRG_15540 [Saprolegnia parasitica CBS 223.65]KDO19270.1 hypothetical protein SPRG_15540 [Saprolegnia parasitica CBS 223.65]|eukprot:XP_012210013.1 hypothetical protein SPRG_15540 [Saprolegnia parasitica CBS 223.65]